MATLVFDLDGTLADTSADLIAAANACFAARHMGVRLDPLADAATAFQGGRAMLRLGYGRLHLPGVEALVEADYPVLLKAYEGAIATHTRLYPGAAGAVATLRAQGYRTAICTNKPEGLARQLLDELGVAGLFDALIGADTLPTRKPDAAPYLAAVERAGGEVARSLLIGDSVTDLETAQAAGVGCALVTFGPGAAALTRLRPTAFLHDFTELPALAHRLLPL